MEEGTQPLSISLVSRPLATAFGGSVALAGMAVAYVNSMRGRSPVVTSFVEGPLPGSLLAVLVAGDAHNELIIKGAVNEARGKPVVFLYLAEPTAPRVPRLFEVVDPYLEDQAAKDTLRRAATLAHKARLPRRFVYRQQDPEVVARLWRQVHAHDVVLAAQNASRVAEINPDRIRSVLTPQGTVTHLLKGW